MGRSNLRRSSANRRRQAGGARIGRVREFAGRGRRRCDAAPCSTTLTRASDPCRFRDPARTTRCPQGGRLASPSGGDELGKDARRRPGDRSPVRRTRGPRAARWWTPVSIRSVRSGWTIVLTVDTDRDESLCPHEPARPTRYARTNPAAGTDSYAYPGTGGLEVVTFLGAAPTRPLRRAGLGGRRPVVAIVDTGCGEHSWLPERVDRRGAVVRRRVPSPSRARASSASTTEDRSRDVRRPDRAAGRHIDDSVRSRHLRRGHRAAGLPRCRPDLDPRRRQRRHRARERADRRAGRAASSRWIGVDDPHDARRGEPLARATTTRRPRTDASATGLYERSSRICASAECVVVCSAGNDATDRPAFPAALWDWRRPGPRNRRR